MLLLDIQVSQETGKVVWYPCLFKNVPQFLVIQTLKSFSVVNEAEIDVFLELHCFLHVPTDADNLVSLKTSLYTGKFSVHIHCIDVKVGL